MPKAKSGTPLRYIYDVTHHGAGLWAGAAVTIGSWIVDHLVQTGRLGKADWWSHPTTSFYVIVFAVGLTITQYLIWREKSRKLRDANKRFRQVAEYAALELNIGPTANRTPQERFDYARKYFETLETEILAGNFSRSGEVLVFKNLFIGELRSWFGGGIGFSQWYSRLAVVVQAVERFAQDEDDD